MNRFTLPINNLPTLDQKPTAYNEGFVEVILREDQAAYPQIPATMEEEPLRLLANSPALITPCNWP